MEGQTFIFATPDIPKIKLKTFLKQGKISPLRYEGQFTTHVMEGLTMI